MDSVFNRMKGGDRENGPDFRCRSGDGSRSVGFDRLTARSTLPRPRRDSEGRPDPPAFCFVRWGSRSLGDCSRALRLRSARLQSPKLLEPQHTKQKAGGSGRPSESLRGRGRVERAVRRSNPTLRDPSPLRQRKSGPFSRSPPFIRLKTESILPKTQSAQTY